MSLKLKLWQKMAIIFSFAWALGMSVYLYSGFNSVATEAGKLTYQDCIVEQQKLNNQNLSICSTEQSDTRQMVLAPQWKNIAVLSIFPAILFWGFAYAFMRMVSMIRKSKSI